MGLCPLLSFGQFEMELPEKRETRSLDSYFHGRFSAKAQLDFSDILFNSNLKILDQKSLIGIHIINMLNGDTLVFQDTIDLNNSGEMISKYIDRSKNNKDPLYERLQGSDIPKKWLQSLEATKSTGFRNFSNKSFNDSVLTFMFHPGTRYSQQKLKVEYRFKENLLRETKIFSTRKVILVNHKKFEYDKKGQLLKLSMYLYNRQKSSATDTLPRMIVEQDYQKDKLVQDRQFTFDKNTKEKKLTNQYNFKHNSDGYLIEKQSIVHQGQTREQRITEQIEYSKNKVVYDYSEWDASGKQLIHFKTEYILLK